MAGPGADIAAAKQLIRVRALAARDAMPEAKRREAGELLAKHGLDLWHDVPRLAAYLDVGSEPPTRPLLDALVATGSEVVVPVVRDTALDWVAYRPDIAVVRGALGVDEPLGERLGAAALAGAEVVLVPALAVDRVGNRLGRGRGYYDRTLAAVTAHVVAVVFDDELVDAIPVEEHDQPVQAVLRPSGYAAI